MIQKGKLFHFSAERKFMNNKSRRFSIFLGLMIILTVAGYCSAAAISPEISLTGQVTWQDLEGGFFGIITPDGTRYLPMNLAEEYQYDGVMVDITGTDAPDVVTIQMWGKPITILSINPVNKENPFVQPWYAPESNLSVSIREDQAEHLVMAASGLQTGLDTIDRKVAAIAQNLTKTGIREDELDRKLMEGLDEPGVLFLTYLDTTGKVTAIVPKMYEQFEGEDVSGQDFTKNRLSYPAPVLSEYFRLIEGMDAVILSYPVFSGDMDLQGYVSAVIDPANLTETYSLPFLDNTGYDLMVTEPDGTILYDGHPDMNGQELWNNPVFAEFPDLHTWAAHFQNAQAGIDQYTYYRGNSHDIATTDTIWTTVGLHKTPWRISVLSR